MSVLTDLPDIATAGAIASIDQYGTPWHGTVQTVDGINYVLHTGKLDAGGAAITLPWVAINNSGSGEEYTPRRKFRNPVGAPVGTLTAEDIAAEAKHGREWRDYAVIAGKQNKLWGRNEIELGDDWLYADAVGNVWRIGAALIASSKAANTGTLRVTITEFGVLTTGDEIAPTYTHDVVMSDIGLGGMTAGQSVLTMYLGDHTETGNRTLLMIGVRSSIWGDDRRLVSSILELTLNGSGVPSVAVLKNWGAMGVPYTYTYTLLDEQTWTHIYETGPGTCGYLSEIEWSESCSRIFHAQYSPAGDVEYISFEKDCDGYAFDVYHYNCGPSDPVDYENGNSNVVVTCRIKKNNSTIYSWFKKLDASYVVDTVGVDTISSTATWTTSLPYRQGQDHVSACKLKALSYYSGAGTAPSSLILDDLLHAALFYMDGWRNLAETSYDDRSVTIHKHAQRMVALQVAPYYNRLIFNDPVNCVAAAAPPTYPVGAKPDNVQAIVFAASPHDTSLALHTATSPDSIKITHDHDEKLHFGLVPVAFI